MGYRTYFSLTVHAETPAEEHRIIEAFRLSNADAEIALNDEGFSEESCIWYDAKEDLKEFSKTYPHILFELYGEGDAKDDYSKLYVKNGKSFMAVGEIVYPEFDESKLK